MSLPWHCFGPHFLAGGAPLVFRTSLRFAGPQSGVPSTGFLLRSASCAGPLWGFDKLRTSTAPTLRNVAAATRLVGDAASSPNGENPTGSRREESTTASGQNPSRCAALLGWYVSPGLRLVVWPRVVICRGRFAILPGSTPGWPRRRLFVRPWPGPGRSRGRCRTESAFAASRPRRGQPRSPAWCPRIPRPS